MKSLRIVLQETLMELKYGTEEYVRLNHLLKHEVNICGIDDKHLAKRIIEASTYWTGADEEQYPMLKTLRTCAGILLNEPTKINYRKSSDTLVDAYHQWIKDEPGENHYVVGFVAGWNALMHHFKSSIDKLEQ